MSQPFAELQQEMVALYRRERYGEALELVRSGKNEFPGQRPRMTFWLACLECRLGRPEEALKTLSAFVDEGGWMSPIHLKHDDDLTPLRGNPALDRIIAACEARLAQEQARVEPRLLLEAQPHDSAEPSPLLMALHMMGGTAEESLFHWRPASRMGFLLAAPQGTELVGPEAFAWGDETATVIERHLASLRTQAGFDPHRVVLGGASQGARMAVLLAMEGSVAARGFIAVVGAPEAEKLTRHLPSAREAGLRGVFIAGEHDRAREGIEATHDYLEQGGLDVRLVVVPGLAHDYPPDFADLLTEALDFILAGRQPYSES